MRNTVSIRFDKTPAISQLRWVILTDIFLFRIREILSQSGLIKHQLSHSWDGLFLPIYFFSEYEKYCLNKVWQNTSYLTAEMGYSYRYISFQNTRNTVSIRFDKTPAISQLRWVILADGPMTELEGTLTDSQHDNVLFMRGTVQSMDVSYTQKSQ